ncbi:uncharacterized protein SCODWIG_01723 [Saccharomycodes ludwigii]|uniref:Reverse transcriptase Ty1/copia-type domain-containing protein n=1 Tax=Saccharomycodes ludwigii TaxID=36035 RepID=A0A376B5Q4_9ASCO|nr:hypothetical protein SCDLUD_001817 [Saccharomycodes ludwigii]KAH3902028.1 hypothetical protein SCDLUD_001817 [Saccharomycodes ludwigii]SSD59962.1 uncharacterized protein SCODWIG_01723 [Saccharomycodes ludwigii]
MDLQSTNTILHNRNINNTSSLITSEYDTGTEEDCGNLSQKEIFDRFENLLFSDDMENMTEDTFIYHMKYLALQMEHNGLGCLLQYDAESVLGAELVEVINGFLLFFRAYFPPNFYGSNALGMLIDIKAGVYDEDNVSIVKDIIHEWSNLYYDGNVSIKRYIDKVKDLVLRTKVYFKEMSEDEMKIRIVDSLKKNYPNVEKLVFFKGASAANVTLEKIYIVISIACRLKPVDPTISDGLSNRKISAKKDKIPPYVKHLEGHTLYLEEVYKLTDKEIKNNYLISYRKELKNLEDNGVYDKKDAIYITEVNKKQIVPLLVLFNAKNDGEYKCQIVARGDKQDESTFNRELRSSNLSRDGLMLIMNMAFVNKLKIYHLKIHEPYLNTDLDKDIYVVTPSIYGKKNTVLKLNKCLGGLRQSGYLWNAEICTKLTENGFKPLDYWSSIFIKNVKNKMIIIGLYVDELIITTNENKLYEDTLDFLSTLYQVKVLNDGQGNKYDILGANFDYEIGEYLNMSMRQLPDKIRNLMTNIDTNVKKLPIVKKLEIPEKTIHNITNHEEKRKFMQRAIGLLNYVAQKYRYDIMFTVNFLSRYQQYPSEEIIKTTEKLLSYVYNTSHYKLTWKFQDIIHNELRVVTNASISNVGKNKSQYGNLVYWNNLVVSAKTGLSTISCIDSTEAEIYGISEGVLSIMNWLTGIEKISKKREIILECNNKSAIKLCLSDRHLKLRNKSHELRVYRMRYEKARLKFTFVLINSKSNEAHILTRFNPAGSNIEKFMKLLDSRIIKRIVSFRVFPIESL